MGGSEHLQDELYNAMRALEDFEVHRPLILLSDDITPEALGTRMVEQGGNAAIVSTEGGLFSMMLGRYSGSSNLDVYLKAHSGDDHRVDRVGRKSDHIERPSLSLSLAFRPVDPERARQEARTPGYGDAGPVPVRRATPTGRTSCHPNTGNPGTTAVGLQRPSGRYRPPCRRPHRYRSGSR